MNIKYLEKGDLRITEQVLRSLPDWFGIEESTLEYIRTSTELPMLAGYLDGSLVGFLSIKKHNDYSAEIYVMGVLPEFQGRSFGKTLLKEAETRLANEGIEYLQVKTLNEERECAFYNKTRRFYYANGFRPLEVFPNLWNPSNPCLLLVKSIHR